MSTTVNYEELFYLAGDGNEEAYNELVTTYVQNNRRRYYNQFKALSSEQIDSLMYFAMIDALKSYSPYLTASILTYLDTCIRNKLTSEVIRKSKKIQEYGFDSEQLEYLQQQNQTSIVTEHTFEVEYQEFMQRLTDEQKMVFHSRLLGKSVREIAEELNVSRTKVNMIQEKLKTKAKQYGLVEKNF